MNTPGWEQLRFSINEIFWGHPKIIAHVRIRAIFFVSLFLAGVVFWIFFFHFGNLSLSAYDWVKEDAYLTTLRLAQTTKTIPWQYATALVHNTDKFLANPEVVLTPDIILLKWISNASFIVFHVVLFYTIGFWGSYLLVKRLNTSFAAFSFFWLLFNFNGYLTAHLAIGHFQWTGYYLIPFFFLISFNFAEKSQNIRSIDIKSVLCMASIFGALFLNGSFHVAIWCSMFLVIMLLFRWTMLVNVCTSILIGALLGFGRILPAVLWLPQKGYSYPGYPTLSDLIDGLTSLRFHDYAPIEKLGWWEYDIFIGFVAFAILIISFSIALKRNKIPYQTHFLMAASFLLLFSLGKVYMIVMKSPIFLANIERVPSRFIVMPFILALILAMTGIGELLRSWEKETKAFLIVGAPFAVSEFSSHANNWRIKYIEQSLENITRPVISLVPSGDQAYTTAVAVSWLISLISFIGVGAVLLIIYKLRKSPNNMHP